MFVVEPSPRQGRGLVAMLSMIALALSVLALSYYLIRRMLKPLEVIDEGIGRIGGGDLHHRIVVDRRDELGTLASSINDMAAEIERMLEAKRALLLAISPELRTPLTRANVSLALLESSDAVLELKRDLAEIESLVHDLLEAERLNTKHAPLNRESVSLRDLIENLCREEFADESLTVSIPDDLPAMMLDPVRIRLMLRNLIDNALRHNRPGRGAVDVACRHATEGVEVQIKDHGSGMPSSDLARAGDPFWRRDRARQRERGGVGLGLFLSRRIAEAHGGSLTLDSVEDEWTRVTVFLPENHSDRAPA